jgi:hypothetical protein
MNQTTDKHFSNTKNNALLELSKSRLYAAHHNPGNTLPLGLNLSVKLQRMPEAEDSREQDHHLGETDLSHPSPLKRIFSHLLNHAF